MENRGHFAIKGIVSLLCLVIIFASCKKKPEGNIIVTTKTVTDITESRAKCGGTVSFTGGFTIEECGICYSDGPSPFVTDFYTEDGYGAGEFGSTLDNLYPNTTYYVRAYARTSSGIKYGNQESFTTKRQDTWMLYGNGIANNRWGKMVGGTMTWAVMFPSSMLSSYNGTNITKIKIYAGEIGTYTIKVYKGGTSSPATILMSKDYSISHTGYNTLEISPTIPLNTTENLWISVSNTHQAGEYPAGSSEGINNPNSRWECSSSGSWYDSCDYNDTDLCWFIQALLSDASEKNAEEIELSLFQLYEEPRAIEQFVESSSQTTSSNYQLHCKGIE